MIKSYLRIFLYCSLAVQVLEFLKHLSAKKFDDNQQPTWIFSVTSLKLNWTGNIHNIQRLFNAMLWQHLTQPFFFFGIFKEWFPDIETDFLVLI